MNHFGLFCKSLVLFAFYQFGFCQEIQYCLNPELIMVEGSDEEWESVRLCKYQFNDQFIFLSDEVNKLVGGIFSSANIEIMELIDRIIRISFIRQESNDHFFFNIRFSTNVEIQKFVRDIRRYQRQQLDLVPIKKMFQYSKDDKQFSVKSLTLIAHHNFFYVRRLDAEWFDNPRSFNFVRLVNTRAQEADLVVQSTTFNVSPRATADQFHAAVAYDVNPDIPCPNTWLTRELIRRIDSPVIPELPHLPYVRS